MQTKQGILLLLTTIHLVSSVIVEIDDGKIEGTELKSRLGQSFFSFFKIPYAQSPLGDLRFQAPRPAKRWDGILNGKFPGPMCFQRRTSVKMSEDCLQLNVFSKNVTESRPVIVFIHGGGYEVGSSLDQGPNFLMDREVVVVTINYRLGPFGFLAMETAEAPGNQGMKDQVLALKWVKKNIKNFGGDKNKVTIAGYSAGAFSVTSHLASKMSKGLFHRAYAMSGSITTAMGLRNNNTDLADKLGKSLNCDPQNLLQCLKKVAPLDLAKIQVKDYPECEIVIWMPVIENDFGQQRFFTEDPSDTFQKGEFNRVPIITGQTVDEFISPVPTLLSSPRMKVLNEEFSKMAPHCFQFCSSDAKRSNTLSKALRKAFLPYETIDVRSFNGLNYLFGDGVIGFPVHKFVKLVTNFTDVYYYKFSYIGRFGWYYPHDKPYGVNHGDDLQYSFYTGPVIKISDPENFMVERMTKIMENFALHGNPNYDFNQFNWPMHDSSTEFYMEIGANMVEKNGLFLERYAVWDKSLAKSGKNTPSSKIQKKKPLNVDVELYGLDLDAVEIFLENILSKKTESFS